MMSRQKFRKIGRYVGYTLAGVMIVLLLAAGGGALWLWGWTWMGSPSYHESWTAEERTAITEFDTYLRQQYAADSEAVMVACVRLFLEIMGGEVFSPGMVERLAAAYTARMVAAPVSGMLHRFAESGDASPADTVGFQDIRGLTPAIIAAQTGHLKALEALVQHGANPNAMAIISDDFAKTREAETPISPLLNGHFTNGRRLPWETRRQTAEFLLARGANLNASRRINQLSCDMALMFQEQNRSAPWEWALNHGMSMNPENLNLIITLADGGPVLERALREKLVDVNDASGTRTLMQSLLRVLQRPYDEETWGQDQPDKIMEKHLDMLLAAGADPNLIPSAAEPQRPGESAEEYVKRLHRSDALRYTPLDIATTALERAELPAQRELCRRIIEKLKLAGARTSDE